MYEYIWLFLCCYRKTGNNGLCVYMCVCSTCAVADTLNDIFPPSLAYRADGGWLSCLLYYNTTSTNHVAICRIGGKQQRWGKEKVHNVLERICEIFIAIFLMLSCFCSILSPTPQPWPTSFQPLFLSKILLMIEFGILIIFHLVLLVRLQYIGYAVFECSHKLYAFSTVVPTKRFSMRVELGCANSGDNWPIRNWKPTSKINFICTRFLSCFHAKCWGYCVPGTRNTYFFFSQII